MGLLVILVLTALAAVVGGVATAGAVDSWYAALERPAWTPPDWLFGPAWTVLYLLMAVAAWLAWRAPPSPSRTLGLGLYGVQLALNAFWSILFFGLQQIGWALVEIVVLLAVIVFTMIVFRRVDVRAAWLFVPYVAWVSFATMLNAAFFVLN